MVLNINTRTILFGLYLVLLCGKAISQERIDLFTISSTYGVPTAYDSIYQGKGTEKGLMISAVAPITISERSIWYSSLNYFYWGVTNDEEMAEDIMNPIDVHGFILRTGIIHQLKNGRSFQIILAPRFMTDFSNVNSTHFQFGAIGIYGTKEKEDLKLGFGALFNQEFFGPNLVPLLDLNWNINNRWTLSGLLPVYAKLKYSVNTNLDVGWSHFGLITTYRLGDDAYKGDYIDRRSIDEALYARLKVFGDFFLESRIGYSFGRSYTQYASDQKVDFTLPLISIGDDREAKTASIQSGLIVSIRLVYSIPL